MTSNVAASAPISRATDTRVSMGAEPVSGPSFAKTLEREVNARQEDRGAESKDTGAGKEAEQTAQEQQAQSSSAQAAAQPWLAMLQVQALATTSSELVKVEPQINMMELDLNHLGKGSKLAGDIQLGEQETKPLDLLDMSPAQSLAASLDAAKFASLRQKTAAESDVLAVPEQDFAALLAAPKEGTPLFKAETTPVLHTPVEAAKPAVPVHTVAEPVGSPRWGDAIAQRVSMMLQDKHQQIDMQLNPPHLGPMEVRLSMSGEQASVVFSSQHAAVREALAAATPRLTMLLADQGIQLNNVQVASDSLNQHAQQQAQQQANSEQMNQQRQSRSRQYGGQLTDNYADVQPRVLMDIHLPVARSGLNLYV